MEQLKVVGTEEGSLLLASSSGARYALAVDDVLRAQVRRARVDDAEAPAVAKASPREIQAQIRAGLSTEDVAALLGVAVDDVRRYEPPVLAERDFIVGQALAVPVLTGSDFEDAPSTTFGVAVRTKLAEASASGERWSSWKESGSWMVKLLFVAGDVERDARWSFDPRRSTLSPLNADATQLSRQGSLPEGLIPRLRALEIPGLKDDSRFDSGAFGPRTLPETPEASSSAVQDAAIKRAPDSSVSSPETADLLEALRRRRGQRTPAPTAEAAERTPAPVALFDALEPGADEDLEPEAGRTDSDAPKRKGRPSMPSWDEIVFGARGDEG